MYLDSDQIEAFNQVAKFLSFSKAAKHLALSQPALSIRIRNLEEALRTSLILRESSGISLTEAGQKLFRHCQVRSELEQEFLTSLQAESETSSSVQGMVRIAGFSTVVKSVLIPCMTELIKKHSGLQIEVLTKEMHELQTSLKRSEAELVITEGALNAGHVENHLIGYEENVVVEAKTIKSDRQDIYFDNDSEDQATFNFFKAQKMKIPAFRRWFLDDATNILEAVEQGWGRAIHPKHIVVENPNLRVVPGFKPVKAAIYLNYYQRPFYNRIQTLVRERIIQEFPVRLARKK